MFMKRFLRILVALALLGGAAAAWFQYSHPDHQDINQLVLYGNVDLRQVDLAINGSERIAELLVEEGDRIEPGQLLARLEPERFEYAVARAQALLETQRQIVARLVAGSRPEEIRKARADVEAAQADVRDREQTLRRIEELIPTKAATQQDLDNARAAADAARARTKARQATLDLAIAGPRKEDIAEAKAMLGRYQAELDQARHDLCDARLVAPSRAIIQDRVLEVGDMATPQKTVFTAALIDPIWVRAYVAEPDLGKIHEGMVATIETDSFPGKTYAGWIGFISPTAEFTPKPVETSELRTKLVYQVRVFAKNPQNELRLGMPATVRIDRNQPAPAKDKPGQEKPGREKPAEKKPARKKPGKEKPDKKEPATNKEKTAYRISISLLCVS